MDRSTVPFKEPDSLQRWLSSVRLPPLLKAIVAPFLIAIAYYVGAQTAFLVGTLSDRIFAPFWPPNIVLLCTLLLVPKRRWGICIAAIFPAHVIAELTVAMPFVQSMVAFATNCFVAILGAAGVRWFLKEPPWFGTLNRTAIYILIASGVSPAVAALGGAFVQIVGGGPFSSYWAYWGNWYISNALGSVTLAPAFLIWFNPEREGLRFTSHRKAEGIALAVGLFATCAIAFHLMTDRLRSQVPRSNLPAIAELKDILQATILEIRTLSYLLHPPALEAVGLAAALRSYIDGFSKRTSIRVDTEVSDLESLPSDVELVLFRVIQEALTNILRHSGSSTARICMVRQTRAETDQIDLTIEDAGKGMPRRVRLWALLKNNDSRQISTGLGLIGMRERLHQVNGRLEIESTAGKTVIRASVPLPREALHILS